MYQYIATKQPNISHREVINAKFSQEVAQCGAVLMENDGTLPLKRGQKVALFGPGAIYTAATGLGAAGVNSRQIVCIADGLSDTGVEITNSAYLQNAVAMLEKQYDEYYSWLKTYCNGDLLLGVRTMYANPFRSQHEPIITEADVQQSQTDTAIYVITRNSGEGADRKNEPGDYQLTGDEKKNLLFLDEHFSHLILILNVCGPIDLRQIKKLKHLGAMLFIGLGGCRVGAATGQLLIGNHVPEGKLTATWGYSFDDYADAYSGDNTSSDVYYTDGMYVGYRYFDSFGKKPAYPFGYGMSYTTFEIRVSEFIWENDTAKLTVAVENTGKTAGRETVQVYLSSPQGSLQQPYQRLIGFRKTRRLNPGEGEYLTMTVQARQMASYCDTESAWIMEPGIYRFRVGNSSRATNMIGGIRLHNKAVLERCFQLFEKDSTLKEIVPEEWTEEKVNGENWIDVEKISLPTRVNTSVKVIPAIEGKFTKDIMFTDVLTGKVSVENFIGSMSVEELATLCVGNVPKRQKQDARGAVMTAGSAADNRNGADQVNLEDMVPGAAITTRAMLDTRRIPKINMADGSSGIRLVPVYAVDHNGNLLTDGIFSVQGTDRFATILPGQETEKEDIFYQYATCLPMATIAAQSWNEELLAQCGEMIGQEMYEFGLKIWLAPALNIQRNPLCGRNFEYFSEDPYISGSCAAALVRGVQKKGDLGATIKHLACNNQEDNRFGANVHVSERVFREIYLKGFEMVIRNEKPMAIMTSLNLINGVHAANSYPMLQTLLRDEWSYHGIVMTDWGTTVKVDGEKYKFPCSDPSTCIDCGNDLIMPGTSDDVIALITGVENGKLTLAKLQQCACRIVSAMVNLSGKQCRFSHKGMKLPLLE